MCTVSYISSRHIAQFYRKYNIINISQELKKYLDKSLYDSEQVTKEEEEEVEDIKPPKVAEKDHFALPQIEYPEDK